ncbi:hypothetical protein [Pectobacterium versatile]|uniref:hypothetical protein n=1 Tax=Pectobacterium versatile TaxID=2488639 RepID=UPI001F3E3F27|nr:hypothetical protein [Pectobacterium versatile]
MNNYLLKISQFHESNGETRYYISDSFGTCLGSTYSLELAYSLIINYINHLRNVYKDSIKIPEYNKYIQEMRRKESQKKTSNEKGEYKYFTDLLTSLLNTPKENKINNSMYIYELTFNLNNKINGDFIFSEEDIVKIHIETINEHLNNIEVEKESDEIKEKIYDFCVENQISAYFPDLKKNPKGNNHNICYEKKRTM